MGTFRRRLRGVGAWADRQASPVFGEEGLYQRIHLVNIERVLDRVNPQVFADHHVARVGISDAPGEGEQASAAVLVGQDRKGDACLLDEGLNVLGRVTSVNAEDENVLSCVALMNRSLDVWKLQTANGSEQCEVGEDDNLAPQAFYRTRSSRIEEAEVLGEWVTHIDLIRVDRREGNLMRRLLRIGIVAVQRERGKGVETAGFVGNLERGRTERWHANPPSVGFEGSVDAQPDLIDVQVEHASIANSNDASPSDVTVELDDLFVEPKVGSDQAGSVLQHVQPFPLGDVQQVSRGRDPEILLKLRGPTYAFGGQ